MRRVREVDPDAQRGRRRRRPCARRSSASAVDELVGVDRRRPARTAGSIVRSTIQHERERDRVRGPGAPARPPARPRCARASRRRTARRARARTSATSSSYVETSTIARSSAPCSRYSAAMPRERRRGSRRRPTTTSSAAAMQLLVDVVGQPHEQLALVAEVEVERGARDPRARGDPLDVQLGERRALGEQLLGRRAGPRPRSPRASRSVVPGCHARHHTLDTVSDTCSLRPWPRCSNSPRRATSGRSPTSPSSPASSSWSPQQLYELWERQPWSAHAIDLERDKEEWDDHRHAGGEGRSSPTTCRAFFIGEERVATQFSGLVRAYEDAGRGGVPHDPAGRRGPPRAVLQPLLRRGPRARRHVRDAPRGGARRRQRGVHPALRRRARQRAGAPARRTRATSRRRSTSSCSTTWSSRARSR